VAVRLLGEMELRAAGQILDVGAPRLQMVLAALAVDAGRPVAVEMIIDRATRRALNHDRLPGGGSHRPHAHSAASVSAGRAR
jgi:hypothetical protein